MENVEIEVRARTVDLAIEAAMQELGIDDPKRLDQGFPRDWRPGRSGSNQAPSRFQGAPASSWTQAGQWSGAETTAGQTRIG